MRIIMAHRKKYRLVRMDFTRFNKEKLFFLTISTDNYIQIIEGNFTTKEYRTRQEKHTHDEYGYNYEKLINMHKSQQYHITIDKLMTINYIIYTLTKLNIPTITKQIIQNFENLKTNLTNIEKIEIDFI